MTSSTTPADPSRPLLGMGVVPGSGYGPAIRPAPRPELPSGGPRVPEDERDAEIARYTDAVTDVAARLERRSANASGAAAEVLMATAGMARDRGLSGMVEAQIRGGAPAPEATAIAAGQIADMFKMAGGLMAERVTDVEDVRDRVIAVLTGAPEPGIVMPDVPSVLLADDLAPADTAGLDPAIIVGIATELGGPTSHTAIIARQLGIPCVVAVPGLGEVPVGTRVLVDGATGEVVLNPTDEDAWLRVESAAKEQEAIAAWSGPGATSDGYGVQVLANVQDGPGARKAAQTQAEGVGLFRTELCFLDQPKEPTVEEQATIYAEVFEAFAGRKVVIRTLDAGSDKPLGFVGMVDEANPALGVRGLRLAFDDPGLVERQLDAIRLAADRTGSEPWVMAPMIATVSEARFFATRCRERGLTAGIMIEIPAAALHADRLVKEVDFLSIGTNDLAQYTMAADRLSATLATLTDPWQPALLALIARTAEAGQASETPVGVCGEAAADPVLACVLVGLGITSLSCAAPAVAAVGSRLARASLAECQAAARAALEADDAVSAKTAARDILGVL
jgi:phosphotransferase system enzyme I (PtsI)